MAGSGRLGQISRGESRRRYIRDVIREDTGCVLRREAVEHLFGDGLRRTLVSGRTHSDAPAYAVLVSGRSRFLSQSHTMKTATINLVLAVVRGKTIISRSKSSPLDMDSRFALYMVLSASQSLRVGMAV